MDASVPSLFYKRAFALLVDPLMLCLSGPAEKARRLAASSIFFCEAAEVDEALGEMLRALTARFGSEDIERVPPVMRPDPEYKPLLLTPIGKSDEIRQFKLLQLVPNISSDEAVLSQQLLAVDPLWTGAMDVRPEVKSLAMKTVVEFCSRHQACCCTSLSRWRGHFFPVLCTSTREY
ncbi:hypothetical protein ETH_00002410 [Eimeria tenella]|uniref:Uncharacterized protein n=1 Tax=Eimeria tenella TaxID=5802 RepID=U6KXN9_EIMTE|nr:hypothetical protein ETH_00002410 [Eimeria tenella]CDJ42736.1 hypothetical protein ETH_00002410 [Eimeria tenella]|eukprot:XP_013233486.1 hypothetical protein ETH_00002410 [Eimeria tenella]